MPELPEVETLRRSLLPLVKGKCLRKVEICRPIVLAAGTVEDFIALAGAKITAIGRRGKYLLFSLEKDNERKIMVAHMRMTGKLIFHETEIPRAKHEHGRFYFTDESLLCFEDVRRFGRLWLVSPENLDTVSGLCTLAREPLDDAFTEDYLAEQLKHRQKSLVKGALLDQRVVAGLGNIYVDEVLYAAKVHPARRVGTLSEEEMTRLTAAMKSILREAIERRGTTFRDYVDANGDRGGMQGFLKVFQREGQPCVRCGALIQREKFVGRSSYFCPHCQKEEC